MFSSQDFLNNRFLALEQELKGWQHSRLVYPEVAQQPQNQPKPPQSDWSMDWEEESEGVEEWESEVEEETVPLLNSVYSSGGFSYATLANMLQNSASQRFDYAVTQLSAKQDPRFLAEPDSIDPSLFPETGDLEVEPDAIASIFFSETADLNGVTQLQSEQAPQFVVEPDAIDPLPFPETGDLEVERLADLDGAVSTPPYPSPLSNAAFSEGEPSYASLMSVLQRARQGDRTPSDSDNSNFLANDDRTIDVTAQAIADVEELDTDEENEDWWDEPLISLPGQSNDASEPALLPSDFSELTLPPIDDPE